MLSYLPEHIQLIYNSLADFSAETPEWVNKDDLKIKDAKSIPEGGMYQGNWNKETKEREGYGIVVWNDGSLYQGYWKKDQPEGSGRMVNFIYSHSYSSFRSMLMAMYLKEHLFKETSMEKVLTMEKMLSSIKEQHNSQMETKMETLAKRKERTSMKETGITG